MIADSDKSLVLYVMNGRQLGINDEKIFLDYVCQSMKDGGKQARERFIFAVNQMDAFLPYPENDGPTCITSALNKVKSGLEDRTIYNPNIFPVCSLPALQKRAEMKGLRAGEFRELNSTCKCNRILINNLFKFFVWREVSKSFTRSIIEFIFNPLNLFVGYFTKVLTLWDILPDKPVGVFIGTTFP